MLATTIWQRSLAIALYAEVEVGAALDTRGQLVLVELLDYDRAQLLECCLLRDLDGAAALPLVIIPTLVDLRARDAHLLASGGWRGRPLRRRPARSDAALSAAARSAAVRSAAALSAAARSDAARSAAALSSRASLAASFALAALSAAAFSATSFS